MKIAWDAETCIHSGNYIKKLPQVSSVRDGRFVVRLDGPLEDDVLAALEADVRRTVAAACPSGALKVVN